MKSVIPFFLAMLGTLVFMAFFFFIFANSVEMVCKDQGDDIFTCQIEKKLLGRWTTSQRTVDGVISARVAEDCNDGCSYRVELITRSGGSEPFDDVYTDQEPMVQLAEKINARIKQNDGPSFSIREEMQWWVVLLLLGLGLMSLTVESFFVLRALYRWLVKRQTQMFTNV